MIAEFYPSRAKGRINAPPSKSQAHRLLLCAGLADGVSTVRNVDLSEDILATIDCLRALGARVDVSADGIRIRGTDPRALSRPAVLPCRECGSTLRFFVPPGLLSGQPVRLTGSPRLLARPLQVYEDLCRTRGMTFRREPGALTVAGPLSPGVFEIPGDISSQFVSGLLFVLPLLPADSEIRLIPPVESAPYIRMTLEVLGQFGIHAAWEDTVLRVPGCQRYLPREAEAEGDYSNAAFFDAFGLTGGDVRVDGLRPDSLQGDRIYREHFRALAEGFAEIDLSDCPDLGPVLMAAAARLHGARFTGTARLSIKESDRGAAMKEELAKMGAAVELFPDEIRVAPGIRPPRNMLSGHNDHRIVMALSFLLAETGGAISGAEAVRKSLPDYFDRIRELGIQVTMR